MSISVQSATISSSYCARYLKLRKTLIAPNAKRLRKGQSPDSYHVPKTTRAISLQWRVQAAGAPAAVAALVAALLAVISQGLLTYDIAVRQLNFCYL